MNHYVLTLITILILWVVVRYIRWKKTIFYPIEKISGPKYYPIVGTLYRFYGAKRSDIYKIMLEVTQKYKPFFRTWNSFNPEVHIMKPEHFEQILTSSVQLKKSFGYDLLRQWLGDGLLLSYGLKWHQRRKMITPTFHFKILENFMNVFEEKSRILVDYLKDKINGEAFDVYPYITHCTLDIICETAMGVSINAMTDRNSSYTKAVYSTSNLFIRRILSPLKQTKLYPLMQDGKMFYENLKTMHEFTSKVIADRRKLLKDNLTKETVSDVMMSHKKRTSFLDLLLDPSYKLSDADIREEVDTFMFEGHDTTTAAISWSLFLLANHPHIQEKAYEEVKTVLQEKTVPSSISELNEMRYLECCVKEALRLYPSVPFIGRCLEEDMILDGYKIPRGVGLNLHIYEAHRNETIFPDPLKYDPDRFLPENSVKRHPYAYVPFSAGPRNCIGQKFVMYEEKTVIASIINSYKIIPVDTIETVQIVFEIVLRPMNGMRIALEKRK